MSLLEQASLVMIPSGYKEDVVYCPKPTDGSGDLTFTRASDGTRVNSSGYVENVPWNLLEQSNTFDTTWTNVNTTETGGQAGYDGSSNAWLLTKSAAGANIRQNVSASGITSISIYVKANASNWVTIQAVGGANPYSNFDLINGVVGVTVSVVDASIEAVGATGWYRCTMVVNVSLTTIIVYPANGNNDRSATSGSIYIQDAQLNQGSTAKPYFPTTDRQNVPRLTYEGGCPSLLLEPQRTNLLTYSEEFSNAAWTKTQASVTANAGTSPDGYTNADKVIADTNSGNHLVFVSISGSISSGTTYTYSFFAKSAEYSKAAIRIGGSGYAAQPMADINLSTGAIISQQGFTSVKVENYGSGWYRISGTYVATSSVAPNLIPLPDTYTKTSDNFSYTGDGTSGVLFYGTQHEAGSYATSYIPTTSAAVTRIEEILSKSSFTLTPTASMSWYIEAQQHIGSDGNNYQLRLSGSGLRNMQFRVRTDGYRWLVNDDAGSGSYLGAGITSAYKGVVTFDGTQYKHFANGALIATFNATSSAVLNTLDGTATGVLPLKQMLIFPTALTEAECIALTTL